jgi:hypothetical protein
LLVIHYSFFVSRRLAVSADAYGALDVTSNEERETSHFF